MNKIGLFGGLFDPVHNGHLYIAQQFRDYLELDEVIFIPTANPPHKSRTWSEPKDRLYMLAAAIEKVPYFNISDIEINSKKVTYTIDTVRAIKKLHSPKTKFYYLIGEDNLKIIKTWKHYKTLLRECQFIVASRIHRLRGEKKKKNGIRPLSIRPMHISSTMIRHMITDGKSARFLIPEGAWQYIDNYGLYKGEKNGSNRLNVK